MYVSGKSPQGRIAAAIGLLETGSVFTIKLSTYDKATLGERETIKLLNRISELRMQYRQQHCLAGSYNTVEENKYIYNKLDNDNQRLFLFEHMGPVSARALMKSLYATSKKVGKN